MAPFQWVELPSADILAVGPNFRPGGGASGREARIEAWNGITGMGGVIYMAGVGGHADWGGNEGYRCDLTVASRNAAEPACSCLRNKASSKCWIE